MSYRVARARMRRSGVHRGLAAAASAALVAGLAAVAVQLAPNPAQAQEVDPYEWRNVEIVGGGFVPNIIFNDSEPDLIYARTDIGGVYRWNPGTQRWIPLMDWVGWDRWGWLGADGVATDPVDPDRLYVAAGMYTNDWDPNNGAVLRSLDRGQTWQAPAELPFKLGGNMPGRGMGERIAVDPNDNDILYLGAPNGNGLWRSTDAGASFQQVASFPNPGNWAEQPGDIYLGHQPGVVWATFDPRTGSPGSATQTIYVGVADLDNTLYRSTDGGATWQRVPGQPTGFMAQKGELDPVGGNLFITTSNNGGPYDGTDGAVWRLDTATGAWTDVTPPVPLGGGEQWFGYSGLSLDRQNPGTLMVTGYSSWWPDTVIYRSLDRGDTWTPFWDLVSWPNLDKTYELDISGAPWLSFGSQPELPEESPKLGWMTQGLAIDPHNSDRMMYGTGATIYGTDNLTAIDSGGTVQIQVRAQGLEETAALGLVKPPGGALVSALGDIGGFRHDDLSAVPALMHQQPYFSNTTSIDFAEGNPGWLVRVGTGAREGQSSIGFSTDGGANWFQGNPPGNPAGGSVAAAADGQRFVWAPQGSSVLAINGFGNSWQPASGVPAGATVASDRVDASRFYAYAGGTFYVSTDGGTSYTATASNLPDEGFVGFKAAPGHAGDVWFAGETGLLRSTDGGGSFAPLSGVSWAYNVGFGAPAPGHSYPAVFAVATIDGVTGVFRSDDAGGSWVRINDDAHQWGNMGAALTGDPDVWGRVYLGTDGRGVQVGEPTGPAPSPTSPSPSPTSPSPSPTSPSPSPTSPTPAPPGDCAVSYSVVNQWPGGFQAEVLVTNTSSSDIDGWTLVWDFPAGQQVTQLWSGSVSQDGATVSVANADWNALLAAGGGSAEFGFLASWSGANPAPTEFVFNGTSCTLG